MKDNYLISSKLPDVISNDLIIENFNKLKNNDKKAREYIILHNLRLVRYIINMYSNNEEECNELFSIGIIGLIKAVDSFNIEKDFKFVTYATTCIRNEILKFFRTYNKYKKEESLNKEIIYNNNILSLYEIIEDSTDFFLYIEDNLLKLELIDIINSLDEKSKDIIIKYFGINNRKKYTQVEIMKMYNISQSRVSKIISKSLKIIKNELEKRDLIESNPYLTIKK